MSAVDSDEGLRRIVAAALTAPSGDNCQPWRYAWDGAVLQVTRDAERARHAVDHLGHASLLTLGCVLEAIALAAGQEGLGAEARLSLDEPGGRWASVRLSPGGGSADPLAGAIARRATDRRLYRGGSLDHEVFAAIRGDAAAAGACGIRFVDRPSRELVDYIARADGYVLRHEEVYRDLLRWVRMSQREVEETRDGVSWRTSGLELPETRALALFRHPRAWSALNRVGLYRATPVLARLQIASSAALSCVTVRSRRPEDVVAAGRLAYRAWLRLNRAGHGVQPLTLASMLAYTSAVAELPAWVAPDLRALLRGGRGVLARAFGMGDEELPVWMFRTGISGPLPERLRTLRLPVDRVLTIERPG